MLTPFNALLPTVSDVEYWALERAAKALRRDPARYQSVEGVEYSRTPESLFHWSIAFDGAWVDGVVGLAELDRLRPHEATKAHAPVRPQHPVQIRPVMALVPGELPRLTPRGATVHFHGEHHHAVTPVDPVPIPFTEAVIADGHHRVAAAIRTAEHPRIMTMIVATGDTPLTAGAFHRVFQGTQVALPTTVPGCEVFEEPPRESIHHGRIAVVTSEGSRGIDVVDDALPRPLHELPAGLVARYLLGPLGLREVDATYIGDTREALAAVDEGATTILLPEAPVAAVVESAQRGLSLPPKSTRFRPKPIRGLLVRPLTL